MKLVRSRLPSVDAELWRNTNFMLLWAGQAISSLGTQVSTFALPFLVLAVTGSPAQAGLVSALRTLSFIVAGIPAGIVIDRYDRRILMIACDIIRALALASLVFTFRSSSISLIQIYIVTIVEGAAFVVFLNAQGSALPHVVPTSLLTKAYALNAVAQSAASLLGPGIAGMLFGLTSTRLAGSILAYGVDALSYFISGISLCFIRAAFQQRREQPARRTMRAEIHEGFGYLIAHRGLRLLAVLATCQNILGGPLYLALILLARDDLHLDSRGIGLLFSAIGIGGLLGAHVAPWVSRHLPLSRIILATLFLQAVGVLLEAAATSPMLLAFGAMVVFSTLTVSSVSLSSYRAMVIPDWLRGRVNSAFSITATAGLSLGTALGGLLMRPMGPRGELWSIFVAWTACFAVACLGLAGRRVLEDARMTNSSA